MLGSTPKIDILKGLDKRLKHLKCSVKTPIIEPWKKPKIVDKVYDAEMQQYFKTLEERLVYRMETWIDVCRIERMIDGVMTDGSGKFHSTKRFRPKIASKLIKTRSFTFGKASSKSTEDLSLQNDESNGDNTQSDLPGPMRRLKGKRMGQKLSPAYSTSDLSERNKYKPIQTPEYEIDDASAKYGTPPKRRFNFFLFFKKNKNTIRTKQRSKTTTDLEHRDNEEYNNNISLRSTHRVRPSLFNMETVRESMPEFERFSLKSDVEQYVYDPNKRRPSASENKFHTVQGIPAHREILFQAHHNDSFRASKTKVFPKPQQLFFEPDTHIQSKRKAEIGTV